MKKIKYLFRTIFTLVLAFASMSVTLAATGNLVLDGASSVEINKNIVITVGVRSLSDSTSGCGTIGGYLQFDTDYLEFVSDEAVKLDTYYTPNTSGAKIDGQSYNGSISGMTINGKTTGASVDFVKLTFKAKKEGTTTIKLYKGELSLYGQTVAVTTTDPTKSITIGAAKNTDATLKSLGVTGQTLSPAFNANTTSYTVTVPRDTTSVTVTGAANATTSTVTGLGNYTLSGSTLSVPVKVTAQSGATKTYTINIKKQQNSDATLKSLVVAGQTLSPAFDPNVTSYTVTVPSGTKITVTGEAKETTSTVKGNGEYTITGTKSIPIEVTAENGTKKTYTINAKTPTSPAASNDATLKGLNVSGYDITPVFASDVTDYTVTVPNNADSIIVNATTNHDKAKVEVTGDKDLKVGDNKVTVKVTAEDGTVKTYTINVKKEDKPDTTFKGDATLKSLEVENYEISPKFDSSSHSYTVTIGSDVNSINVKAIATDPKGTVSVSGNTNLKEGVNSVIVRVTNEDGKTSDYVINVIKEAKSKPSGSTSKSSDSYLKSLTINSAHTIDKTFDKNIQSYAITVPYEVEKLDLNYEKNNSKASVKITGNENFKVGVVNTVTITVNAEDGSTRLYLLNVIRSPEVSGTDLEKLVVGGKDIYKPNQSKYEIDIDSKTDKIDISAIPVDKDSKVEVIGNSNLKEGKNTVWVKVTDKKGYEKLYEITVNKEVASKGGTFLGLSSKTWGFILGILGFLIILGLLLLLLFKRRKDDAKTPVVVTKDVPPAPVIEFKPEFNFGSKNTSDDDVVHGNMNQNSQLSYQEEDAPKKLLEAEVRDAEEVPYDPFDETITKDEIVDAIHEAMKTKNTSKLRMLLDQDELNQRKKDIKRKEEEKRRYQDDDEDDFF